MNMQEKVSQVLKKLEANGFNAKYFASRSEAVAWMAQQVPAGEMVSFGGSVTLTELGLRAALEDAGADYMDYRPTDLDPEEAYERWRKVFKTHSYFLSANAVTEKGYIVNVDGRGNRVAASLYGPKKVYFVVGNNKLVADIDAAIQRIEDIAAPRNCQRLNLNTPCVKTNKCEHCGPNASICRAYTVIRYAPYGAKYHLVWIDEELGY